MTRAKVFSYGFPLLFIVLLLTFSPRAAQAQRDDLTDQETEAVRLNQELDKRILVFVKAADRRFDVLADPTGAAAKVSKKDLELYGPLPTGTRLELLTDIAAILDEASEKIDDVAEHDEANPLIPKALKKLSEASQRYLSLLKAISDQAKSEAEKAAAQNAIANAQLVIEAANKHG